MFFYLLYKYSGYLLIVKFWKEVENEMLLWELGFPPTGETVAN